MTGAPLPQEVRLPGEAEEGKNARVKFGFVSAAGSPQAHIERAVVAEEKGWDGFFIPDGAYHFDPWVLLAAIAGRTQTIRLGTMLTPLPWKQPWTVAAQAASVDQISGGRVILAVGLGSPDTGRADRGEPMDKVTRAQLLDDGLEIITRLWRGEWSFEGTHYHLDLSAQPPRTLRPVQQPRIPIWVVGGWNRPKSMRRAVRYDGVLPQMIDIHEDGYARSFEELAAWVRSHPHDDGTVADVIKEGHTTADDPAAAAARTGRWRERGATWWIEADWTAMTSERLDTRARAGPPRSVDGR
jgi:alkanesulfonate monooxygenase SsuD/methylene tetrahydromethanopterin reductase-like flavin-dependent oxidoreductase (luciferase family)